MVKSNCAVIKATKTAFVHFIFLCFQPKGGMLHTLAEQISRQCLRSEVRIYWVWLVGHLQRYLLPLKNLVIGHIASVEKARVFCRVLVEPRSRFHPTEKGLIT